MSFPSSYYALPKRMACPVQGEPFGQLRHDCRLARGRQRQRGRRHGDRVGQPADFRVGRRERIERLDVLPPGELHGPFGQRDGASVAAASRCGRPSSQRDWAQSATPSV